MAIILKFSASVGFLITRQLSPVAHHVRLQLTRGNNNHVAWLEWDLRTLMSCLFSYVTGVFSSQYTQEHSLSSAKLSRLPPSFTPSLSFSSFLYCFTSLCLHVSSSFLSSASLLPLWLYAFLPGGAEVSVIRIRTRPRLHAALPSCSPQASPPPWENGHDLASRRTPTPPSKCAAN